MRRRRGHDVDIPKADEAESSDANPFEPIAATGSLPRRFLLFDLSLRPSDRRSFFCCDDAVANATGGCSEGCIRLDETLFSTEGHFFELPSASAGPFGNLPLVGTCSS